MAPLGWRSLVNRATRPSQLGRRGVQAIRAFQEADNLDATPRLSDSDEFVYSREAEKARAGGEILLQPVEPLAVSGGEAITRENQPGEIFKLTPGSSTPWRIRKRSPRVPRATV